MSIDPRLARIQATIRDVPDFPKPGIIFKDISPVLQNPVTFRDVIDLMCEPFTNQPPDCIVAIDARGFLFGSAMAYALGSGVVLVRKQGKLPWKTYSTAYDLEYGSNTIEIHRDGCQPGDRVLIVDDVLATGGTARATIDLVERLNASIIGVTFLMELTFLHGRDKLSPNPIHTLVTV